MDDTSDRDDQRRARNLRIAIRLVFYPLALGLIAFAWQHYHGDSSRADPVPVVKWGGVTSQGRVMKAVSRDGLLLGFDTEVLERCSDGSGFTTRWFPGQGRFVQTGEQLRGRQSGTGHDTFGRPDAFDYRVWARIDGSPQGTIRAQERLTSPHGVVHCESGAVTFTLRRSG